jgi:hydrophobic/amphiphilic exporter-1 (mainly G- bacteria), HAE1 family
MSVKISSLAIRNPLFPSLLFGVLCILGLLAFQNLPEMRFPTIDRPVVNIGAGVAGMAPTELEAQVTRRIEDAVAAVPGVKHIMSTVTDGQSLTSVEFRLGVPANDALTQVKDAVAGIRSDLPAGIDDPIIQRDTVRGDAIRTYAINAPAMTELAASWFIDDAVIGQLQGIPGVGRVDRVGGVTRQIHLALNPDRMMVAGITATQVNTQLQAANIDLPAGTGSLRGQDQTIRSLSAASSLTDLAAMRISLPGGGSIPLADLGTISDAGAKPTSFASVDGKTVVAISIYPTEDANDLDVARLIGERLNAIGAETPGVSFDVIDDTVAYTDGNYQEAMRTLHEGALLSVFVVLAFLRNGRATFIACAALPLSAIPTFWVLSVMGFSLNLVTLLAITLSTGILVDDSIVEIENIFRHLRMGKAPFRAACDAADEIALPVMAISLTIIAIFAPVSFMPGVSGQYFKQFGITVSVAVFFSLLVARMITPMMAAYLMRPLGGEPNDTDRIGLAGRIYARILSITLLPGMRWVTLAGGVLSLVLAIMSAGNLPAGFIPAADESRLLVSVQLAPGSTLPDTARITAEIATRLHAIPQVQTVYTQGGVSLDGINQPRQAVMILGLTPKDTRGITQTDIQGQVSELLRAVPDIVFSFDGQPSIAIVGSDGASVESAALAVTQDMHLNPLFAHPLSSAALAQPEIRVTPNLDKASGLGISPALMAGTIRVAMGGDAASSLAKYSIAGRQVPILVELDDAARADPNTLGNMQIPTASGGFVPLRDVAEIAMGQGQTLIQRYDRGRLVTVTFDPAPGHDEGEVSDLVPTLAAVQNFPSGVHLQEIGDSELQAEMFAGFAGAMGMGILLVYLTLILLFGSVFQPITILTALPLSLGGAISGLILTGSAFCLPVIIGFLMLMGIVTKNSIMVVEFAVELEKTGTPRKSAIIQAALKRARPIVMTTVAMTAGMAPAVLGSGVGGEFRAPMAAAVIGGLIASTALSLLVVPAVYTMMDDLSALVTRVGRALLRPNLPDDATIVARG